MIKLLPRNILRFFALVIIQVLVFNNLEINGYINPYIYILFILLLPFETPHFMILISGFLLGIFVDIFSETLGLHTLATVFMAYIRPYVLSSFAPRDGYGLGSFPRVHYYGWPWFIKYTSILTLAHHLVLFYAESFTFEDFFGNLYRTILSSIFSIAIICFSQFFVFRK